MKRAPRDAPEGIIDATGKPAEVNLSDKMLFSIYFRVLLNYLQIVSLAQNFNLKWPQGLKDLFDIQFRIGNIGDFIFSYDCLIASKLKFK